jgi:hypothetical protein
MLSKQKWIWCAEHHIFIKKLFAIVFCLLATICLALFIKVFWWQNKVPSQYPGESMQRQRFGCNGVELGDMFIPSMNKLEALKGDLSNYSADPLERSDARFWLLENHRTVVLGAEILDKRPECIGAYMADFKNSAEPFAILIVDRQTKKTVFD